MMFLVLTVFLVCSVSSGSLSRQVRLANHEIFSQAHNHLASRSENKELSRRIFYCQFVEFYSLKLICRQKSAEFAKTMFSMANFVALRIN